MTEQLPPPAIERTRTFGEIDLDLLGLVRTIYRKWPILLLTTLLGAGIGAAIAFHAKPYYSADAVFLPPKTADLLSSAPSSLFGASDTSDVYLALLQSRTVSDDVIDHLGLMQVFHAEKRADAQLALAAASSFSVNKNSLIQVTVTAGTPQLAAEIANMYLEALYRLNGQMVASGSVHRRAFFEHQLDDQRKALLDAETDLKRTQEKTGVVLPVGEAQAGLSTVVNLQSQIGAAEARLAGLLTGATESNPEVKTARNEISQLQSQLARQESTGASAGRGLAGNGSLPALTLEAGEKTREVTLREQVYETLAQQYERARLSSIDPGAQLQIVDQAVPPERKAGPARRHDVTMGALVGLIAGLFYLFGLNPLRRFARILRQPHLQGAGL